jgi:hypothetical protein
MEESSVKIPRSLEDPEIGLVRILVKRIFITTFNLRRIFIVRILVKRIFITTFNLRRIFIEIFNLGRIFS